MSKFQHWFDVDFENARWDSTVHVESGQTVIKMGAVDMLVLQRIKKANLWCHFQTRIEIQLS